MLKKQILVIQPIKQHTNIDLSSFTGVDATITLQIGMIVAAGVCIWKLSGAIHQLQQNLDELVKKKLSFEERLNRLEKDTSNATSLSDSVKTLDKDVNTLEMKFVGLSSSIDNLNRMLGTVEKTLTARLMDWKADLQEIKQDLRNLKKD